MVRPRWNLEADGHAFLLQVLLKPMLTYGKGEPGDSHPIINEWGESWVVTLLGPGILFPRETESQA
jgi:hypothetical protein